MPASRKRNKGKDRKAKKEANKVALVHRYWRDFCAIHPASGIECDHGCIIIPSNHPVSKFMDLFYLNMGYKDQFDMNENLLNTYETFPEVWNNERYKEMAIKVFIATGTNMILRKDNVSLCIAYTITVLTEYDGTSSIHSAFFCRASGEKNRDLDPAGASNTRDLLKFYRKRTSCKCLKKMHLEARKSTPKNGFCWGCNKEKERVALSVCSRCMVTQYCSRECQVANLPQHKVDCDNHVQAHREKMGIKLLRNG